MKKTNQSGLSLLETAVILPVVLAFIFGSIDVTNYFRSYNAVREGVNSSLRCLYPTDAGCVAVASPQTVTVNDQFVPPVYSKFYDYDGQEKKLFLPDYTYGGISARTLESVNYSVDSHQYISGKPAYDSFGYAKVISVEYPSIKNPDETHLTPRQAIVGNEGIKINDATETAVNGERLACNDIADEEKLYKEVTFTIPALPKAMASDPDLANISGCNGRRGMDTISSRSTCTADVTRKYARLFFKLNGTFESDSLANGGHLNLFIHYQDEQGHWRPAAFIDDNLTQRKSELGGQDFNNDSSNFYPRGFLTSEVDYNDSDGEGLKSYNGAEVNFEPHGRIYIPWGSNVKLSLTLRPPLKAINGTCSSGGHVGWKMKGSKFIVGKPTIESEQVDCRNPSTLTQCRDKSIVCKQDNKKISNPFIKAVSDKQVFDIDCSPQPTTMTDQVSFGCQDSLAANNSKLLEHVGFSSSDFKDYISAVNPAISCPNTRVINCPTNFGVTDPATQNPDGTFTIKNSAEAEQVCPTTDAIPGSQQWSEKITNINYSSPITKKSADCSFNPNDPLPADQLPAEARPYKKLILPTAAKTGTTQMDTAATDPAALKNQPQYSCAFVTTENRSFSEDAHQQFNDAEWQKLLASDFYGPHHQLGCSATETLKAEAKTIGLNDKSYFAITKQQPTGTDEYQVSMNSVDRCTQVRVDQTLAATNLRSKVAGGPFDQGVIPPECLVATADGGTKNICISLPAGVRKLGKDGKVTVDQNQAKLIAQDTIKSFLASAKVGDPQCQSAARDACAHSTDPNCLIQQQSLCLKNIDPHCSQAMAADCVAVEVTDPTLGANGTAGGEAQLLNQPFTIKATVQQPLLLLGNQPVAVAYQGSRNWEGR